MGKERLREEQNRKMERHIDELTEKKRDVERRTQQEESAARLAMETRIATERTAVKTDHAKLTYSEKARRLEMEEKKAETSVHVKAAGFFSIAQNF